MHESRATPRPTWWEMTVGFVGSLVLNVGYMFVAYGDQRVILMLILTVVLGMGIVLGAAAAVVVVLALVGIFDWTWLVS
jgi:hypothetical protein